jgi:hypothetical protein
MNDLSDFNTPVALGEVLQNELTLEDMDLGLSVPGNASISSGLIYTKGYKFFSFGLTSSQNGSISIQRYLDNAGTIAQGAALTLALTAGTPAVYTLTDTKPFQSMKITVLNSEGTDAVLSNSILLLQAN